MAVSDRSNPSLARFWGFVLAIMFYAFVMAALLGFPAHKTGTPLPGPASIGRAQVAGWPHPESEASALTEKTASARPSSDGTPVAGAAPPSRRASPTQVPTMVSAAKPTAGGRRPESEASASTRMITPTENDASAQPRSGTMSLAAAAPPSPQADATQEPAIASGAKPTASGPQPESGASASAPTVTPTDNATNAQPSSGATALGAAAPPSPRTGPTQGPTIASGAKPTSGGQQPESEASASAPMVTPTDNATSPQPSSGATPLAAAALPASQAVATQVPTIVIAAKPIPPAVPRPTLDDVRHHCGDGGWTWQSPACPAHLRPVAWRWVLRGCAIRVGHLCIGPSYAHIEVVSRRQVWH